MRLRVTITGYIDVEDHWYDGQPPEMWPTIELQNIQHDDIYAQDTFNDLRDRTFVVEPEEE